MGHVAPGLSEDVHWIYNKGGEEGRYIERQPEKVVLVVSHGDATDVGFPAALEEARRLVETAGGQVVAVVEKKGASIDPAFFVGKGKAQEIARLVRDTGAELVVVDADLTPAQSSNLEDIVGERVVDRTELILDIFARRARTREGKLQVEAAQLRHLLPKLRGSGVWLSKLGGGIGTRGPGETKLEMDRRRIKKRLKALEEEIRLISKRRALHRELHCKKGFPVVALVGYTNAGKSTLFNALTRSNVYADDRLFATLDPTTRALKLPSGRVVLLVDTVGFIRNLPHELVAAFRATLEEVVHADLLVHVVDASSPNCQQERDAVLAALAELGALSKPMVTALNKIDLVKGSEEWTAEGARSERQSPVHPRNGEVPVSALWATNLEKLLEEMDRAISPVRLTMTLRVPHHAGAVLDLIYAHGSVRKVSYDGYGVTVEVDVDQDWAFRLQEAVRRAVEHDPRRWAGRGRELDAPTSSVR